MFNKLKQRLNKGSKNSGKKEVILCIHGFGRRLSHEYDNFLLWSKNQYHLEVFDIYDLKNPKDCDGEEWIKRCERKCEEYLLEGYELSLIGFSMGGVIATHLAAKYNPRRLFLIAPAFDYINVSGFMNTAVNKILKSEEENPNKPVIPTPFYSAFREVVSICKDDLTKVKCPVCFVHGNKDELIPLRSSMNAFEKIPHNRKRLFIIHEGKHRMMMHTNTCYETYQIFKLFIDGIILGNQEIKYAKDILAVNTQNK